MDPYDLPYTTTVTDCLAKWGTNSFAGDFLDELVEHEADLPLENMCINGGSPSWGDSVNLSSLVIVEESTGNVSGTFDIFFIEESPTGCRDMPWSDGRSGKIHFRFNLETGEVVFDKPMLKREPDPEEL